MAAVSYGQKQQTGGGEVMPAKELEGTIERMLQKQAKRIEELEQEIREKDRLIEFQNKVLTFAQELDVEEAMDKAREGK